MNSIFFNHPVNKKLLIITLVISILLLGNVYLGVRCFWENQQYQLLQKQLKTQQDSKKIISFLDLFIEKVLKADSEVSFEDRLKLENSVRDLGDEDVLAQWEKFIGSTSEEQVQSEVKNLLSLLVKKMVN